MDENTKELIAIGASVATNCQPCLTHHVDKADEMGIDEADIRDALSIGAQVRKGGVNAMQRFIELSFRPVFDEGKSQAGEKSIQSDGAFSLVGKTVAGSGESCPGKGCC